MLIAAALDARQRAYAPYSRFQVGAALLSAKGAIIPGCNVENASYGLTICAERVAMSAAISLGHRQFLALAVAASGGPTPCGACRQFLVEFAPQLPVIIVDADAVDRTAEMRLDGLLPSAFHHTSHG